MEQGFSAIPVLRTKK